MIHRKYNDLPDTYKRLAELRCWQSEGLHKKERMISENLSVSVFFDWDKAPEGGQFWIDVYMSDTLPSIPISSLEEIARATDVLKKFNSKIRLKLNKGVW